MRNSLRQRESDLQYQEVAKHFARLDIHPGYLSELAREPLRPTNRVATVPDVRNPLRTHATSALDYISFGVALIGMIVAISTAFIFYQRVNQAPPPAVAAQAALPDPNIARLNESVRRLGLALSMVVADMQENPRRSDAEGGKVVEVAAQKANLRIAPDTGSSAVMAIARGSRLLVDLEQNEWLRVFAPNGQSLWLQKALTNEY